ncbi:MAG: hypothetical protein ACRESZ_06035, partial [Methylococcales bacterium]
MFIANPILPGTGIEFHSAIFGVRAKAETLLKQINLKSARSLHLNQTTRHSVLKTRNPLLVSKMLQPASKSSFRQ